LINDIDSDDDNTVDDPGEAQTIDLTDYFRGGTAPFEYGTPTRTSNGTQAIEVALVDSGPMLTVSVVDNGQDELDSFEIKVTDADGSSVDITVNARRNDAPEGETGDQEDVVGTQPPAEAPATIEDCPLANECVATVEFADDDAEEMLTFTAVSADTSKVEVVRVDTEGNTMANVVLRGIASTWAADATPDVEATTDPGHIPVMVTITATDRGGETVEDTVAVRVDGAPVAKAIPGATLSRATPTYTIPSVVGFFTNPEDVESGGETLEFSAESSDTNVATVTVDAAGTDLVVTRNAPGPATITVTATESGGNTPPNQTAKGTFLVTVTD
jgi:hypothetical protein